MQGFNLIVQIANQFLGSFGLLSMLQAFVGAVLFVAVLGYVWDRLNSR